MHAFVVLAKKTKTKKAHEKITLPNYLSKVEFGLKAMKMTLFARFVKQIDDVNNRLFFRRLLFFFLH